MKNRLVLSVTISSLLIFMIYATTSQLLFTASASTSGLTPWQLFKALCPYVSAQSPQCIQLYQQQQQQLQQQQQQPFTGQQPFSTQQPQQQLCPDGSQPDANGNCPTTQQQTLPIANAGPSQTVNQSSLVTLDGTGSFSPNGSTIVSYSWVQTSGTAVSLTGANTATPTFTAPTATTSLTFSLTVTDSTGAVSSPSTVTISVG
jgi:hypothetical protein